MEKFDASRALLDIGAVFLRPDEPFIWASGIKAPIYCDNRLILSAPEMRSHVEQALADMIRREFPGAQALMGTATAGIAHAAIAAHILGIPMGYVRASAKDHGRQKRIDGRLEPGERVVVVEDLISTGGSALDTVETLREAGAEVLGVAALFTYGMAKGSENLAGHGVRAVCLTDFDSVVASDVEDGKIPASYVPAMMAFRDHPEDESWVEALK